MSNISTSLIDLIDMRSFSSLWYWIVLSAMWSLSSHWVIGVPYDMVPRAKKESGQSMADLEALVRVHVKRRLQIGRAAGLWLVGVLCFVLAGLFTLGFFYGFEIAQASFLLLFPLAMLWLLSINTAAVIEAGELVGQDLCKQLTRHRMSVQILGAIFIFATAIWGMYQNFVATIL